MSVVTGKEGEKFLIRRAAASDIERNYESHGDGKKAGGFRMVYQ